MKSLAELRHEAPLSPDSLLDLALGLSEALVDVHARDLVHGGLHPTRILWDGARQVELLAVDEVLDELQRVAYWSPEQYMGDSPSQRSDIWSAGVVILEMATGSHPFWDGDDREDPEEIMETVKFTQAELPGRTQPDLWLDWDALLSICTAKNPRERFASALDLETQLQKLEREGGRARIRFEPHWPRIAFATALVAAILLTIFVIFR